MLNKGRSHLPLPSSLPRRAGAKARRAAEWGGMVHAVGTVRWVWRSDVMVGSILSVCVVGVIQGGNNGSGKGWVSVSWILMRCDEIGIVVILAVIQASL